MSWMLDLAKCTYFRGLQIEKLIAVGWLESGYEYPTGQVPPEVIRQLIIMLEYSWNPVISPGLHNCSLCPDPDHDSHKHVGGLVPPPKIVAPIYRRTLKYQHHTVTMGSANLFLPGDGVIYASPSLILHYILQHRYAPPLPFQDAVLNCPPMRSRKYFEQMDEIAGKWWWLPEHASDVFTFLGVPKHFDLTSFIEGFDEIRETVSHQVAKGEFIGQTRTAEARFGKLE